jgi:polyphosphate kinase 2 (PPK2 family)
MLEKMDLKVKLGKADYKAVKPQLQRRLLQLQRTFWKSQLSVIVVIEGWDGAGKGSAIQKLTQKIDPRSFKLHSIHDPRTYETQLPWLWRFWARVPNWGEMAIFDHSWYGRVLEDRINGDVPESEWRQAYNDINSFERTLADDRYLFAKFFLHIDRKTQKKRFKKLEGNPLTNWQVDDEDWKQNRLYPLHLTVIEEMLERTETEWAPWILIEATNQRWARIKILRQLVERMEEGLRTRSIELPPVLVTETRKRREQEAPATDEPPPPGETQGEQTGTE